jgi:hypothetical protein
MPIGAELARRRQLEQHIRLPTASVPLNQIKHAGLKHKEAAIDPGIVAIGLLLKLLNRMVIKSKAP